MIIAESPTGLGDVQGVTICRHPVGPQPLQYTVDDILPPSKCSIPACPPVPPGTSWPIAEREPTHLDRTLGSVMPSGIAQDPCPVNLLPSEIPSRWIFTEYHPVILRAGKATLSAGHTTSLSTPRDEKSWRMIIQCRWLLHTNINAFAFAFRTFSLALDKYRHIAS